MSAGSGAFDPLESALASFETAFDDGRYGQALACAQAAARVAPDSPAAHLDRAVALDTLGRTEDAHQAYNRALALAPDDPEVNRAFADFLVRLGSTDALETALLLARRGREAAAEAAAGAQLAALEAEAANVLGRSDEALSAAESALALDSDCAEGALERAVALVELLRFSEAAEALARVRAQMPRNARAAWYAGMVLERQGREEEAKRAFAEASTLDPESYPAGPAVGEEEFAALVRREQEALSEEQRKALATARLELAEFPAEADLQAGDPVLSPTIVGLFRPGWAGSPDTIVLYRRNLLRLVTTREELVKEVRQTLLHELGHLEGEDDAELRDRGL